MSLVVSRRAALGASVAILGIALAAERAHAIDFPDWYTIIDAAENNNAGAVAYLLNHGEDPNYVNQSGRSPLDYAAIFGNTEMIKVLVNGGARVDYRDKFGSTPLHWAADRGQVPAIKLLIADKAPVDAQNQQGLTPLMVAASAGKVAAIRALLSAGADPKKQDFTGRDAIGWAAGQPAALQVLKDASAN